MRDLTKAVTSFSWALSLFGARQALNLMDPGRASSAFESVARATEGQLGESLRSTYRLGDRVQRTLIDTTFGMLRVAADPAAWTRTTRNLTERAGSSAPPADHQFDSRGGP